MPIFRRRKAGMLTLLIMGLVFTVAGGCVSWFLGGDTFLTCQRSADLCVLEKSNLLGQREVVQSFPLSQLKSAEVTEKRSTRKRGKKGSTTYKVTLNTSDGTIPFSGVSSSDHSQHQQNADAINAYLASKEESLSVVQSGKIVRLIGYAFFGVGLLMLLGASWRIFKALLTLGFVLGAKG